MAVTLADTSALLDVLLEGATHGDESEARLATALQAGPVVINDIVAAELAPVFEDESALWSTRAEARFYRDYFPRIRLA